MSTIREPWNDLMKNIGIRMVKNLAIKGLKAVETEMRSLARKFSAEKKEDKKQGILNILKKKTAEKKELESLVAKLEKNATDQFRNKGEM